MPTMIPCLNVWIHESEEPILAALDHTEKLCYISKTYAQGLGLGVNGDSLRTTIKIKKASEKIAFQVLDDKSLKFRFWKIFLVLGSDFIEKIIAKPHYNNVKLTVERLQKPFIERGTRAILLSKSQFSEAQPHEIHGPFTRNSSHRLIGEGDSIEILASDRGIDEAFKLLQSRLQRGKTTKLSWFPYFYIASVTRVI